MSKMKYSKIITYDTSNCHGYSTTIWVSGCDRRCEGCFNQELWDYNCGKDFTENSYRIIYNSLNEPHIENFVLLGGEPLSERNRKDSIKLLTQIKKDFPNIKTIVYTGFTLDELNLTEEEKDTITYLIDGKYDKNLPVPAPQLRGSLNQKCYKLSSTSVTDITDEYFR